MQPTVGDITRLIDQMAPFDTAEADDNVGLLVGNPAAHVHTILMALDATLPVLKETRDHGAQLLITHHPIMFSPIKRVLAFEPEGALILQMGQYQISMIAAHTNWDRAKGGVGDELCRVLNLPSPRDEGLMRLVALDEPMTLEHLAGRCRHALNPLTQVAGDIQGEIRRIAVVGGAAGGMVPHAAACNADVLLCGELKHHEVLMARGMGLATIQAGHVETEVPGTRALAAALQKACDEVKWNVQVIFSSLNPYEG